MTALAGAALTDWRTGGNIRHSLTALLRQSVYGHLAEVTIPRPLFQAILQRIRRLRLLAPAPT